MSFGERVREKRRELGFSQQKLAELAGVSLRTINNYESGDRYPNNLLTVKRLAQALHTTSDCLLDDESALLVDANARGGVKAVTELQPLLAQVGALFAGGELSETDKDKVMRAITDMYWQAKENNKKYAAKKP